jgi:hypothetical protein
VTNWTLGGESGPKGPKAVHVQPLSGLAPVDNHRLAGYDVLAPALRARGRSPDSQVWSSLIERR